MSETQNEEIKLGQYDYYDYQSDWVRGESFYLWGRVKCYGGYNEWGEWESITLDELKLVVDQPYYDPEEEAKDCGYDRPSALCFDFKSLAITKNGITDRDRMRRKLQWRLKKRAERRRKEALAISNKGFKPCRYKACKGRAHGAYGEKCPIASGRGKIGGKNGTGASKARKGAKNGRSKGGPKKRTQTAARLKAGEIKIKTGEIQTVDPFAYYQDKINGGA